MLRRPRSDLGRLLKIQLYSDTHSSIKPNMALGCLSFICVLVVVFQRYALLHALLFMFVSCVQRRCIGPLGSLT